MKTYAPRALPPTRQTGWYNYVFETDAQCAGRCAPGSHPLYIGKSNDPRRRHFEHLTTQSWYERATGWRIYPERYATEAEALAAEEARIRADRPLANIEHNRDNPCRLYFGPPSSRPVPAQRFARRVPMSQSRRHRRWSRRQVRAAAWAGAWLVLAVAGWVWGVVGVHLGWRDGLWVGAGGATAALLVARRAMKRRRWRG